MSLFNVFEISGSALSAENVRLNTVSSNIANAETVAASEEEAYRSKQPVFSAVLNRAKGGVSGMVKVDRIVESQAPVMRRYEPGNPLADGEGYVYGSNVNTVEEMANMISASRAYQNNIEVLNTSKQLLLATLKLGQ